MHVFWYIQAVYVIQNQDNDCGRSDNFSDVFVFSLDPSGRFNFRKKKIITTIYHRIHVYHQMLFIRMSVPNPLDGYIREKITL